jgi:hypothetical protein
MNNELMGIEFLNDRRPTTMAELVQDWIAYASNRGNQNGERNDTHSWAFYCVCDLCGDHPLLGFQFVLAVLTQTQDPALLALLAAGPLEDILAKHGPAFIDQVENEARRSPRFRHLLGGVWQNSMADIIWHRVLKAAPDRW